MAVRIMTIFILLISVLFPLLICAPLETQENDVEDSDLYRTANELIMDRGYPVENHFVTTQDGFILNMQRIPHGWNKTRSPSPKPVVFLQHGLTMDSTNWILNGRSESLAYILADRGFDVWLGNIRGNRYSQKHIKLDPSDEEFWDWSWQEMAKYDLPAMINRALNVSGQAQLFYVGHSQGTLIGFTGFSSNPQLASKVKMFFALAPVYTVGYVSEIIRTAAYAMYPVLHVYQSYHSGKMLTNNLVNMLTEKSVCGGEFSEKICYDVGEELFGFDSANINMSRVPVILSHWGSGTSFKNFIHFGQMVLSKKCAKYDYGFFSNYRTYGQLEAPEYHVEDMKTPTALFSGSNDKLASPTDVRLLKDRITNLKYFKEIQGWNHADFLFGNNAPELLYSKLINMMETDLTLGTELAEFELFDEN